MRISDLSEEIIRDDAEAVMIEVQHPDFGQTLKLDGLREELVDKLPDPQDVISLKIEDQQYLMSISDFNALFTGSQDAEEILERASLEQRPVEEPKRGRRRQQTGERKERISWSDPSRAGLDHPGRVSKKEQIAVQELGIEAVNRRRVEAGQEPLTEETAARYGLAE
jgi:hypothetical protein